MVKVQMVKRRKNLLLLALIMLIMFSAGGQAAAITEHVYDDAGLFSSIDREEIEEDAAELSEAFEMDILIVTTDDPDGMTSAQYADAFFDEYEFEYVEHVDDETYEDGLLLLINMDERDVHIETSGITYDYFTDHQIDMMLDEIYPYLADEDYTEGVYAFLDEVEYYVQAGIPDTGGDGTSGARSEMTEATETSLFENLLSYLAISALIGASVVYGMARNNRGRSGVHKGTYLDRDSFRITRQEDVHFNTRVTKQKIQTNSGTSRGRSGSRRSTYRSGGGNMRGGRGRKF